MAYDHIGETSRFYPTKRHGPPLAYQAGDVATFLFFPLVFRRPLLPGLYQADGRQVS